MKISGDEVKSVLESLVENKLSALQVTSYILNKSTYMHIIINSIIMQTDLLAKLRKKEESLSGRLSKLEKNL